MRSSESGGYKISKAITAILAVVGFALALIFLFTSLWALISAIGYLRLMAGKGLVARWHVTAAEWDRFRAFDRVRASEDPALCNDMRFRKDTPLQGVDVIVGRSSVIVDDSYHMLQGRTLDGRQVNWLGPPADPECIEFPKSYPRSHGGSVDLTLRLPVPAAARSEGVRVLEFWRTDTKR